MTLGNRAVLGFRDLVDDVYHLNRSIEASTRKSIEEHVSVTDACVAIIEKDPEMALEATDVRRTMAGFTKVYLDAAAYYEHASKLDRLEHVKGRINKCLSFVVPSEIAAADDDRQNGYMTMIIEGLSCDELQAATLQRHISFQAIAHEQLARLGTSLE